jgi:hypothetical protein
MSDARTFEPGQRVRVRRNYPHTLPHFAQMLEGVVEGIDEEGSVLVRFEEHIFPLAADWLEHLDV